MHRRLITTIFMKDLIDAIRDARVLVAVVVPLGLGLFYNVSFSDQDPGQPSVTVAYFAAEPSGLPEALREVTTESVTLTFVDADDPESVTGAVRAEEQEIGLVVPAGFDAALLAGDRPTLTLVQPDEPNFDATVLIQAVGPALRTMAGQVSPAVVEVESPGEAIADSADILGQLGFQRFSVTASLLFVIAMVTVLALPVILAEETEKRTYEALVLIASPADIIIAKALVGLVYAALGAGSLTVLTGLYPAEPLLYVGALLALTVTLTGFGLFVGGVFRNANQINTWSGILLIPIIGPVFFVGLPAPNWADALLLGLPASQAMRIALNASQGAPLFGGVPIGFAVIIAWGALAYALLGWQMRRRMR